MLLLFLQEGYSQRFKKWDYVRAEYSISNLPEEIQTATGFPDLTLPNSREELINNHTFCTQCLVAQDILDGGWLNKYPSHWWAIYLEIAKRPDHPAWKWVVFKLTNGFVYLWGTVAQNEEWRIAPRFLYNLQVVNRLSPVQLEWYIELITYCMTYGSPEIPSLSYYLKSLSTTIDRSIFNRIRQRIAPLQQEALENVPLSLMHIYFPKLNRWRRIGRWVKSFFQQPIPSTFKDLEEIHKMEDYLEDEYRKLGAVTLRED